MASSVPSTVALTSIADGANIVAADHRNNYTAIQTAVNALIAVLDEANAKGDILIASGADAYARLGVGVDGQVLIADSAQTLGVKWGSGSANYRKTTAKAVNTTVAVTDLLNAEITVAAGAMGLTGALRLTAWGDWKNNSGGTAAPPRFQLVFGGTTLLDTGTGGTAANDATRRGWELTATILNSTASAQTSRMRIEAGMNVSGATVNAFTTGEGRYRSASGAAGEDLLLGQGVNTATAVDTSSARALVLNVINGSANAAYETQLIGALIEVI